MTAAWSWLLAVASTTASAAVDWDAPETCPTADAVEARVRALSPDSPPPDPPLDVDVAYVPTEDTPGRWQYRARVRNPADPRAEPRYFAARECVDVAEAVALYVAVASELDPSTSTEQTRPPGRRLEVALGVDGGVEYGALPSVTGGVRPRLSLGLGPFVGIVYGEYWVSRPARHADVSARVDLGVGGVMACGAPGRGRVSVPLCGGAEAGVVRAFQYRGVDRDGRQGGPWVAMTATAAVRVRLAERIGLWVGPQIAIPLLQQRFTYVSREGTANRLHATEAYSARVHVGIEFFPKR